MRTLAAIAVTATALVGWPGAAHATPNPTGTLCGFAAVADPQLEGYMTGAVVGGPVAFPDDTDVTLAYTGRIVCTLQTGPNDTHVDTDAALPVEGFSGRVSSAAASRTFEVGENEPIWLGTHVEISGRPPLYWDADSPGWSPFATASCELAISFESPDPSVLDAILCPILNLVFPPDGDVVVPPMGTVWDCPPYDSGTHPGTYGAFLVPRSTDPR